MGEKFLPHAAFPVTSTICEVRYGNEKKFRIHYKDSSKEIEEIKLLDQKNGQSCVEQLTPYVRKESDRDQGSKYAKIEIFWTHELLKVSCCKGIPKHGAKPLFLNTTIQGSPTANTCDDIFSFSPVKQIYSLTEYGRICQGLRSKETCRKHIMARNDGYHEYSNSLRICIPF